MTRKVCVVVASRANYGRVKYLMRAIAEHESLELQVIVGASTLLERFGKAVEIIQEDGFTVDRSIHYVIEGENLITQAKSTGLGIVELATAIEDLDPDVVVSVADRFETMATAVATTYLNKPLAHLQGGEVSGNIDDRVRHAITKLADLHFVATEESKVRVERMGEAPSSVFNFGCPSIDTLRSIDLALDIRRLDGYGSVGNVIDWSKPYVLVVQHPVTTSFGEGRSQVSTTLSALREFGDLQKIVLWPNIDAGSDDVSKGIRVFRENTPNERFSFYKNFSPEDYARILNSAQCCIGNSSSFIRECAYLGVPAVIIGDRQLNRESAVNVANVGYDRDQISAAISAQLKHGRYPSSNMFGDGFSGKHMAETIASYQFSLNKPITY